MFVLKLVGSVFRPRNFNSATNNQEKKSRFTFTKDKKSEKVFSDNEGEYVDFEEVKENDDSEEK